MSVTHIKESTYIIHHIHHAPVPEFLFTPTEPMFANASLNIIWPYQLPAVSRASVAEDYLFPHAQLDWCLTCSRLPCVTGDTFLGFLLVRCRNGSAQTGQLNEHRECAAIILFSNYEFFFERVLEKRSNPLDKHVFDNYAHNKRIACHLNSDIATWLAWASTAAAV